MQVDQHTPLSTITRPDLSFLDLLFSSTPTCHPRLSSRARHGSRVVGAGNCREGCVLVYLHIDRPPYKHQLHTFVNTCASHHIAATHRPSTTTRIMSLGASSIKGPWSTEEDQHLARLVYELGSEKWVAISSRLQTRTGKQCRERWHNHLDPKSKFRRPGWPSTQSCLTSPSQQGSIYTTGGRNHSTIIRVLWT